MQAYGDDPGGHEQGLQRVRAGLGEGDHVRQGVEVLRPHGHEAQLGSEPLQRPEERGEDDLQGRREAGDQRQDHLVREPALRAGHQGEDLPREHAQGDHLCLRVPCVQDEQQPAELRDPDRHLYDRSEDRAAGAQVREPERAQGVQLPELPDHDRAPDPGDDEQVQRDRVARQRGAVDLLDRQGPVVAAEPLSAAVGGVRSRPVLHPEEELGHLDGLLPEQDQPERADDLEDRQRDQDDPGRLGFF